MTPRLSSTYWRGEELKQLHFLPLGAAHSFFLFFFLSGQILASFCDCLQYQHAKMEGKLSHLNVNGGEEGGGEIEQRSLRPFLSKD